MARGRGKNDDDKDNGRHNVHRDGDTGRRGNDDQHSRKLEPKKYERPDRDGKDRK